MGKIRKIEAVRKGTRVVLQCRVSFVHLAEPWSGTEGNQKKYSVSCIVPKEDRATVKALEEAFAQALEEGTAKCWKGKKPNPRASSFKRPLKDGDVERPDDEAYAGSMYFTASSKTKPATLDRYKKEIDAEKIYSGCHCLVSVNLFPYAQGSNGVAAGLNSVLFFADGDRLSGGGDGRHDFDEIEGLDEMDDLEDL